MFAVLRLWTVFLWFFGFQRTPIAPHGSTRETPPNTNSRKKLKHPIVKAFQTILFRAPTKTEVLVFVHFDLCPCFVARKFGKEIISLSWGRCKFNQLVSNRKPHVA